MNRSASCVVRIAFVKVGLKAATFKILIAPLWGPRHVPRTPKGLVLESTTDKVTTSIRGPRVIHGDHYLQYSIPTDVGTSTDLSQRDYPTGTAKACKNMRPWLLPLVMLIFFVYFSAPLTSCGDEITGGFRFVSPGMEGGSRWKVEGDQAEFISDEIIEIRPVRAVIGESENPDFLIRAEWARLNKNTKDIWTESPVEIIRGRSELTGVGLNWTTRDKKVTITKNVKMVVFMDEAKLGSEE